MDHHIARQKRFARYRYGTRQARILYLLFLVMASMAAFAQSKASINVTLSEQGKPVPNGLVVLQRLKNAECVKFFESREASPKAFKKWESCAADLPWSNTDANGKYDYPQLSAGWYNVRFLWLMEQPPRSGQSIACRVDDWAIFFEPGKDRTGKYNAMAQGKPFELKEAQTMQISFDYRGQLEASTNCISKAAEDVPSPAQTGKARISFPGTRGILEVDPGPTSWRTTTKAKANEVALNAVNRADHLLVTAFLQQVSFAASADKCRDVRWRNSKNALSAHNLDTGHVTKSSKNGMALVEFFIDHSPQGRLGMKDVHAYMGSGDLCAEVHLSKVSFQQEEQKLFDEVLASVRFLPEEKLQETAPQH